MSSVNGFVYQLKLLMLFVLRGVLLNYEFSIGKEIKQAKKFDDLVFIYKRNGQKFYRFLQSKHRRDESKKINVDHLLTDQDTDFGIVKYFFSYIDIRKEGHYDDGNIQDVILCTNVDLEYRSVVAKNKLNSSERVRLEDFLERIDDVDDMLDVPTKGMRYRFNDKMIPVLKPMIENYNLIRVAKKLSECVAQNDFISAKDYIFEPYFSILVEKIINIEDKKFSSDFIEGKNLCPKSTQIRKHLLIDLEKKKIKAKDLVNLFIKLNFFDEIKYEKFDEAFSFQDIKDFLNHFVLAVNQPNEIELGNYIEDKISKLENYPEFENMNNLRNLNYYDTFYVKMLEWMKGVEPFISQIEGKAYLNLTKSGIKFDLDEPVKYFTGRNFQLEQLHKSLCKGATVSQFTSISGLSGIGKTELVKKYAQLYSKTYDENIIWIDCESQETIEYSFKYLASAIMKISLFDLNGNEKDILSIARDVYAYFSNRKSLFIFDNAESNREIVSILPHFSIKSKNPYVIITSRNQNWDDINVLSLDVFTKEEAMMFIKNALCINSYFENDDADDLADILLYNPLALRQAVSYINKKNHILDGLQKYSTKDYIREYQEKMNSSLNFYDLHEALTLTTWNITFGKILSCPDYGKMAIDILYIISYVFYTSFLYSVCDNHKKVSEIMELLKMFSMIKVYENFTRIHCSIQQVIRINAKNEELENECIQKTYDMLKGNYSFAYTLDNNFSKSHILPRLFTFLKHENNLYICNHKKILRNIIFEIYDSLSSKGNYNYKSDVFKNIFQTLACIENTNYLCTLLKLKLGEDCLRIGKYVNVFDTSWMFKDSHRFFHITLRYALKSL